MGLHETKIFCTEKKTVTKLKRKPREWEKNLCQLYIGQGITDLNLQGAQKTTPTESMIQ
jgi:hypothetical protein